MCIRDRRRGLACIGPKAKGVEELGAASGLPTGLLLGTLMKLELAGRVTCLPGKMCIRDSGRTTPP